MPITIKTEKVVTSNGTETRKILEIEALGWNDLPEAYRNEAESIYLDRFGVLCHCTIAGWVLRKDSIYSEEKFQNAIEDVRKAGDLLCKINKELKQKRAVWNGEETFVI